MNTQMQYHNPENVPADKVPKGWRFLTMEEQRHRARLGADAPMGCRYWFPDMDEFSINSNGTGATRDWTYIIPDTQPEPAPSPWKQFSKEPPPNGQRVIAATAPSGFAFFTCFEARGDFTQEQAESYYWLPESFLPPLPVERKKSQEELDKEAAKTAFPCPPYPFLTNKQRAFLAGLRHARAQGKEQP